MSEQYKSRLEKRRNQTKKKPGKKKGKGMFKKIFLILLVIFFLCLVGGVATAAIMISKAPEFDPEKLTTPVPSTIYDMNGEPVAEIGTEKRDLVEFDEIPKLVVDAIIATEDSRFFKHTGIDPIRLGGAVISNITDGFGSQGGSTITQQVVKMYFLTNEKTITRKVQEAWLALQLERHFSKEEIFELYVNKVSMGGNVYGIKEAANTYFGKELDELTLPEAAIIAGLPQRPNAYNPFVNPDLADKRKNTVLHLMHQHGYITEEEMLEAQEVHASSLIVEQEQESDDAYLDSFIDQIIDEVEALGYDPFTEGLQIYSTLDPEAQKTVYNILNTDEYVKFPDDRLQAGVVLLDTSTGEIRAIGGGRNQEVRRGYNFAMDIQRQPGSTIKPVLAYGPAIEDFKWSTYHQMADEPHTYSDGTKLRNWDNSYKGVQSIRYHLAYSRNIPAVKTIQEVGLERAKEFAEGLGIPLPEIYESYVLGGFDTGVAPVHMAGAFSAFGNGGIYNEPHVIRKIVLADGVTEIDLKPEPKVAMSDYTAFMITDMLRSAVQYGTATRGAVSGVPIAAKTGTTNYTPDELEKWDVTRKDSPDSWYVGYSPLYTAAVWVGNEQKKYPTEKRLPAEIFKDLMTEVHKGKDVPNFKQPESVVKVGVVKGSNPPQLPNPFTPEDQIVYEYFVKGTEPTEVSQELEEVPPVQNLKVDYDEANYVATLTWEYPDVDEVEFEVRVKIDGSNEQTVTTTSATGLNIEQVEPGHEYTFIVIAKLGEQASEPATVPLDTTSFIDDILDGLFPPDDEDEQPGDGNRNGNHNNEPGEEPDQDHPENPGNNGNPDDGDNPNEGNGEGEDDSNDQGNHTGSDRRKENNKNRSAFFWPPANFQGILNEKRFVS